ncbi:MAG: 2-oxoglutarate ferredoxin oxidoreductase subunit delta [Clostridia bacterium]|nr:2-oxoglutarate ferredoxin oxidoreductase subunit delta [Clostridia bacterium]
MPATSINIDANLCKGCKLCLLSCKEGVLTMSSQKGQQGYFIPEVAYPERCTQCLRCEYFCPDMAIEVLS